MLTDIKVGLTCNNACRHCIMEPIRQREEANRRGIDATFEQVCAAIDAAASRGDEGVTLTGGEVTIRRDLFALVRHALDRGLTVTIQTNGRRLVQVLDVAFVTGIANRKRVSFVVALHGSNASVHDAVTRRPGSFDETISGIRHVHALSFPLWGKVVLSLQNLEDAAATLDLLSSLGVRRATVAFPHAEDFDEAAFREVVPRYRDLGGLLHSLVTALPGNPRSGSVDLETIPYCVLPDPALWRSSMDIEFTLARLRGADTSIRMAMDDRLIDWTAIRPTIKTKPPVCGHCLMDRLCEGPWSEYIEHFGDEEFRPITDQKLVETFLAAL
jgi:sulfatase maturation enzyme AslB (radical SAM superfamily)